MVRRYNLFYTSMAACPGKATGLKVDVGVQTVIRVYPHVLSYQVPTRVASDKKMQTEITLKPEERSDAIYSLLKFTPYQDIQENSLRIIDLPRQVRLQFNPGVESNKMAQAALQFSLADDDGVGYICCDIIHRMERKYKPSYVEVGVQTDLTAYPHLLKTEQVSTVTNAASFQTDPNNES